MPASSPSPASTSLLILGAGGHGRVVADAAALAGGWSPMRVTDRDPRHAGKDFLPGLRVLPFEEALAQGGAVHVAIGINAFREREALALKLPLATVVHPDATVSAHASVAEGAYVGARTVVAPGSRIGACVIVNHGAVVDHDAEVGDFSHVAPQALVGGFARIGRRVLVGPGARVLARVQVADDVTIGAGAVVSADITEPGVYEGMPARKVG